MTAAAAVDGASAKPATDSSKEAAAAAAAAAADAADADDDQEPPTPPIFIKGLSVLSPRQKPTALPAVKELSVPLPPLRPEEPVASVRNALSEVVGFAHLTRYRLVVERREDAAATPGARNGSAGDGGNKSRRGGRGEKRDGKQGGACDGGWSSFTLRNAQVTVSPSQSLEAGVPPPYTAGATNGVVDDSEEEMVLDEYSDLSSLLPLLENDQKDAPLVLSPTSDDGRIVLDASHLAIRVVLERYDLASVKDHLGRVKGLFEGNAPYVVSLKGDENEKDHEQGEASGGGKVPDESEEKETEESKKDVKKCNGKKEKEESEAEKQAKKAAIAAALPSFLNDYDVLFESSAQNGDLTNFYFYVCGEEQTLTRLQEERSESETKNGGKEYSQFSEKDWLLFEGDSSSPNSSGNEMKENKKKGNGRKKKSKNASQTNQSNVNGSSGKARKTISTREHSIVQVERTLHELSEAARVPVTLRLSGYHPPPAHRRVLGDLAYLEATMPDGSTVFVTAFSLGFYVNRSTAGRFDPTPMLRARCGNDHGASEDACYSHALLDCLLRRSKPLRAAWAAALAAARERSDLLRDLSWEEDALHGIFRPVVSSFTNNASGPAAATNGMGVVMSTAPRTFAPRVDSIVVRPSWLVPLPSAKGGDFVGPRVSTWEHSALHCYDANQEEDPMVFGMDVRGGGLRDWNEELQTAREMPVDSFGERIERARLVHKVLSDFGEAALQGVKAILDGYILPMNPNEPLRSHVYLHNNIFFSRAVDSGLDTFKIVQGDNAAKKSASRDAHNIGVLHRLDIPGLHTLATLLVEYLGTRIVCQSVVPGILHGEKSHSLLYGAVETLSALRCDEEMHKLLEGSIGEGCMVATRSILAHPLTEERMDFIKKYRITPPLPPAPATDEKDDEDDKDKLIQVCGPMEMKGILGSDKRKYVLDCTRLTPRDANWIGQANGGTGRWEEHASSYGMGGGAKASKLVPSSLDDDEWMVCVLRPELVTSYSEMKINKYLVERQESAADAKSDGESGEAKEESSTESEKNKGPPLTEAEPSNVSEDKEWVSVPEIKKEAVVSKTVKSLTKEALAKVEEEYIKSLRYNVNVFLPHTRSIEPIDKEAYGKLQQDEEQARKLARHLWDTVIPNLTKEVRSSSGNGLQLPVDGRSLTELIHQRGINCRYLGRLAELARKEELEDAIAAERAASPDTSGGGADKKSTSKKRAPRFRMPLCWLEMLECEMVARAAKHVLDAYVLEQSGGASSTSLPSAQVPAQTIASFLSAVVSVGEESAAETERRTASKGACLALDQEDMNALTLFDVGGGSGDDGAIRGRDEIWSDIEREIGHRYRYTLSLYNNNTTATSSKKDGGEKSRALYTPLLRRICQRSGIRIVAKRFEVGKKCVCGGGGGSAACGLEASYPIAPTDILDILPLVKHAASVSGESFVLCSFDGNIAGSSSTSLHVLLSDAKAVYEFGHANLSNGNVANIAVTLDCAQEAAAMYQRVLDSQIHPQISKCLKLTAVAHYHKEEAELAVAAASKYLAVSISLYGFDSAEVLNAHLTMADILLGTGKIAEGVKHLRAAQFLMEFMAGKHYSGISSTYYRMGSHYYDAGKLEDALRFYRAAAARRSEDRMFDCLIARNSAGVLARLGQFKSAFDSEKKAYQLYVTFLGEEHDATKACSSTLIQLMKLAVEQEKKSKIQENERVREIAADAVADQIGADEEAEEEAQLTKKKKKKQSKKKSKK